MLESSWGYDQTNVDFYEVVKVTATGRLRLRKIAQETVRSSTRGSADYVVPRPGVFVGEAFTRLPHCYSDRWYVSIESYSSASRWDGSERYQTGVGWGH